jgi:hypothetical protein
MTTKHIIEALHILHTYYSCGHVYTGSTRGMFTCRDSSRRSRLPALKSPSDSAASASSNEPSDETGERTKAFPNGRAATGAGAAAGALGPAVAAAAAVEAAAEAAAEAGLGASARGKQQTPACRAPRYGQGRLSERKQRRCAPSAPLRVGPLKAPLTVGL